jgi:ADP-dependent NAD(P)H-hydrate dehydratase
VSRISPWGADKRSHLSKRVVSQSDPGLRQSAAPSRSTLITPALLRSLPLPKVDRTDGKDARGCVLVIGGSEQIPGAVILAATAALRAGAGKLQIATSRGVAPWVAIAVPEARVIGLNRGLRGELGRGAYRALRTEIAACDAMLVGPGMNDPSAGIDLIRRCLRGGSVRALVVDAAPLAAFDRSHRGTASAAHVVLTPHAGEMATLCGMTKEAVLAAPLTIARLTAKRLRAVVALKGACTYIAGPDGSAFHNNAGNEGLGTSGSGDTLSGLIAGLSARGADPLRAAIWGVYLHARAGDALARRLGRNGFLARELSAEIPALLDALSRKSERPRSRGRRQGHRHRSR